MRGCCTTARVCLGLHFGRHHVSRNRLPCAPALLSLLLRFLLTRAALSIVPSYLFLLCASVRLGRQVHRPVLIST